MSFCFRDGDDYAGRSDLKRVGLLTGGGISERRTHADVELPPAPRRRAICQALLPLSHP